MGTVRIGSDGVPAREELPSPVTSHVQEVLQSAHEKLLALLGRQEELNKRIRTAKGAIFGMAALFGKDVLPEELLHLMGPKSGHAARGSGITKACRQALMESGRPLRARDVCRQIDMRAPEVLRRHKNPVASISTVLNRLEQYGVVRRITTEKGRRMWVWIV